jgi:hydroxymethylpyrimidine/phosphomethylpyrimidine kinase
MALMACLLGYGEVGLWLKKEAGLPSSWVAMEGNPYRKWIEDYSGVHYQNAVRIGIGKCVARLTRYLSLMAFQNPSRSWW